MGFKDYLQDDFSVTYSTVKCADTTLKTQKAPGRELTDSSFCIYENFSCKNRECANSSDTLFACYYLFGFFFYVEGTVKPAVSFMPNWRKIFVYESMTLACNVDPRVQGIRRFYWYKDNVRLNQRNQSFTIHSALQEDGGSYQCKADKGAKSDPAKLKVLGGWLILQVPQLIYEGDSFTLKCHSYPGYEVKTTVFLLHEKPLNSSGDELPVGKVNLTTADQYKCKKEIFHHNGYRVHTDMELVVVTELYSSPEITVTPYPARAGGNITVTCHVNRSPLRPDTKLEIAFYRNDRKVQGFGSSDKYQISAARPGDSGDYSCEAKATANNVRKMSRKINIQIQGELY
ncbi:high affinity immunoglobulin gamma Fc receptor I-like [Spea bombifrons]|uniref:high affinity immunoglobulin gamma Fc receptor I-like n=1 Tax=Spea bombifrons TaxID=233779 RepID=UPI00234AFC44|nr:high affinity immunoglobulin gamma Fc receptor I-like [Spea bombifrons]